MSSPTLSMPALTPVKSTIILARPERDRDRESEREREREREREKFQRRSETDRQMHRSIDRD